MATKNISISEEAYNVLVMRRLMERESFSEVIKRELGGREKIRELFGIFKGESGENLERNLNKIKAKNKKADKERRARLKKAFS